MRHAHKKTLLLQKKFGKLTVISYSHNENHNNYWNCRCDCGNEKVVRTNSLNSGRVNSCGCLTRYQNKISQHKIGDKIGFITITGYEFDDIEKKRYFLYKCICGYEGGKTASPKKIISCGCMQKHRLKDMYKDMPLYIYKRAMSSAKSKEIEWAVTIEYLYEKFIEQEKRCAYSGIYLTFAPINTYGKYSTASIDRIDSKKGYIPGNVQWVHKDVNFMKYNKTEERFLELVSLIKKNKIEEFKNNCFYDYCI